MRQVVLICNLFFSYSLTIASMSSYFFSFIPKIMRFKALLVLSLSNSMSLFISSLIGLISNLLSKIFGAKF
jgi:hypothetical protein